MDYTINSTKDYHTDRLNTLGWELTICNALYPDQTPLRKFLTLNRSFGSLLYDYLSNFVPMRDVKNVIEIGGGYGYLMKDFLEKDSSFIPTMVDLSPFLIEKQKEILKNYKVTFIEKDFLDIDTGFLTNFDLAIMNENLGDFPTVVGLKKEILKLSQSDIRDPFLKKIRELFDKYLFLLTDTDTFNLNIGAIEAIEKLCNAGIPFIYAGEHSCEASPPNNLKSLINIIPTGNPERISLMGHDEYSIRFSHLEQVAKAFGYTPKRGAFADFIPFDLNEELRFILASHGSFSDEGEMICHFIEDLYKYEYLILIKDRGLGI